MSGSSARREAAATLSRLLQGQGALSPPAAGTPDAALIQELCYGVCRHYQELAHLLGILMPKPLKAKDSDVRALLLMGLYQMFHMRVPDHATLNETVGAVRKPWARGLVNAVLREARRRYPEYDPATLADPALRHSHPSWLVERLRRDWPEHWTTILPANNARAPMTLRVNRRRSGREDYRLRLAEAGIESRPGALAPFSLELDRPLPVQDLDGFAEGVASVQDEASQLAATLLALEPGLKVLDACAAPGGKTCAMLELEEALDLLALDNDEQRLERVRENLHRLDLPARVVCGDAGDPAAWWDGTPFDRILLDVPCSGTGVIRRHPDIKLLRREDDIAALAERQRSLLAAAWTMLKPQGLLLYSTCSVLKDENTRQIATFLRENPGAREAPLAGDWGVACEHGRQLLPGQGNHDGFYYALLRKY